MMNKKNLSRLEEYFEEIIARVSKATKKEISEPRMNPNTLDIEYRTIDENGEPFFFTKEFLSYLYGLEGREKGISESVAMLTEQIGIAE